ncbi:MAG: PD40 domain-containing protein [Lentisphaeria bacterium]|nr:PD40 domain-containing protein [Lentisphaeria bacterium]
MKKEIIGAAALMLLAGIVGCKSIEIVGPTGGTVTAKDGVQDGSRTTVKVSIFDGEQKATVSKGGYLTKKVSYSFDSPNTIRVSLDREFNIKSSPADADIYVNGSKVGTTPAERIAINDGGSSTVEVRKKGWLPAKMTVKKDTPVDITLTMDQDGSGRTLLDLVPTEGGLDIKRSPVFSDTDVGEHSASVSACKRLTNQSQTEYILSFSLLADGKTLVTSILEEVNKNDKIELRANIWQLNTSIAGAPRKSVTQGDYFDIHPNPSPDGNILYFSTTRNGRLGVWNLKMNEQGGLRTVTSGNTADFMPSLRPGTDLIYYSAVLPGTSNPAFIWNRPLNGGMPEQLTEGTQPQWSPDGKKLLYVKGSVADNKCRIWTCDPDGSNQTLISSGTGDFNDIDPRWSNDSSKIIFASDRSVVKDKHNYDIYIMDADGGNLTQLTTNSSRDDKPVFAPDGKTVFFRSNRGLVWDIWTMQIKTDK